MQARFSTAWRLDCGLLHRSNLFHSPKKMFGPGLCHMRHIEAWVGVSSALSGWEPFISKCFQRCFTHHLWRRWPNANTALPAVLSRQTGCLKFQTEWWWWLIGFQSKKLDMTRRFSYFCERPLLTDSSLGAIMAMDMMWLVPPWNPAGWLIMSPIVRKNSRLMFVDGDWRGSSPPPPGYGDWRQMMTSRFN